MIEQLDRIENNIDDINADLDTSKRLLRGIESIGGATYNYFTNGVTPHKSKHIDRTLNYRRDTPEFAILNKLSNDQLQPAILRFSDEKFMCCDPVEKNPLKNCIWSLDKIESIVIRARHQHCDVRFKGKIPRFRFCSSYLQGIVSEFHLRSSDPIDIIFEGGTRAFKLGRPITHSQSSTKEDSKQLFSGFTTSRTKKDYISETLLKDAPDDVKTKLDEQDKDLDQLSHVLTDLNNIAKTMGQEVDRSNKQLDQISNKTDEANSKLYQNNQKIKRIMK